MHGRERLKPRQESVAGKSSSHGCPVQQDGHSSSSGETHQQDERVSEVPSLKLLWREQGQLTWLQQRLRVVARGMIPIPSTTNLVIPRYLQFHDNQDKKMNCCVGGYLTNTLSSNETLCPTGECQMEHSAINLHKRLEESVPEPGWWGLRTGGDGGMPHQATERWWGHLCS